MISSKSKIDLYSGKFSGFTFIFTLLVGIPFSYYLSLFVFNFPDFNGYDYYVINQKGGERFWLEPFSGWLIDFFGSMGGGGYWFYLCSIVILVISFSIISAYSNIRSGGLLLFIILCVNPLTLVIIHTPRFSLALSFLLLSCQSKTWAAIFFCIISIMFHLPTGFFTLMLIVTCRLDNRLVIAGFLAAISVFIGILYGYLALDYSHYLESEVSRGSGRVFLFVLLAFCLSLMVAKDKELRVYFISLSVFTFSLYLITPFAHRFSSILGVVYLVLMFQKLRGDFNKLIFFNIYLLFIYSFILILSFKKYYYW